MYRTTAKIAVSAATYWIDKPYDYLVPPTLAEKVQPGVRVTVPFSRGNRAAEGIVLALGSVSEPDTKLKTVTGVLDEAPVLSPQQIKLALWMRERFFCTVYEAVKAMLPVGIWYKSDGGRVRDKTVPFASLNIPADEARLLADARQRSAPMQAAVLRLLADFGGASYTDIRYTTGASSATVKALSKDDAVLLGRIEVFRRPEYRPGEQKELPELTAEQLSAYEGIIRQIGSHKAGAALLQGVTGSGKTAVYVRLIDSVLKSGGSAILLVPEIALTPQMLQTFSSYFGENIAVLHSSLSAGERYDEWKRVKNGDARVVIGTRSAVFAPVTDLGLIIVDEEQEETYKSQNSPRYNTVDVAKFRCSQSGATLLLGSATPDIVTAYRAKTGQYSYFTLNSRYNNLELPSVQIVDMKKELREGGGENLSRPLLKELAANLSRGEQSILFLNRRGMSKLISCRECGYTYVCPNCSVNLTYHSFNDRLMCHYCGYSRAVEASCPQCGGALSYIGAGTQKIEEELKNALPGVGVIRMDTDTVMSAGSHEALLDSFRNEAIPILLGTQMVTKGLDFPNVTLVGVISADQALYAGNYRSSERAFSLLTQVIGRSGRGDKPGRAIIQTFTPGNQIIAQAARQDYESFYASELEMRRLQWCPPFSELFALSASGMSEAAVLRCLYEAKDIIIKETASCADVRVLGPAPLSVVRVNNRFRYRLTIAGRDSARLRMLISGVICYLSTSREHRGVSVFGDIDPED